MTGFQLCKWIGEAGQHYGVRYCNLMAMMDDDLCTTHRAQVDAELRMFEAEYRRMVA
jgi:hypothetical protein